MIYCVEDDDSIRELIVYTLQNTGFEARGFEDGELLFEAIQANTPELILLDIMLPGEDGIALLKKLKSSIETKELPIIMVTAKGAEYDKVISLDYGADDYITKPFGMMELIARIKAVLRRVNPKTDTAEKTVGDIILDSQKHIVKANGQVLTLTLKEFDLLRCLMDNQGVVMTRDKLLERVWGYDFDGETRTVDVHIRMLRQKLGSSADVIETIRGVGYRIGGGR